MRTDKLFIPSLRRGRAARLALTLQTYLIGPLFESGQGKLAILTTVLRVFRQFLNANDGVELCYLDWNETAFFQNLPSLSFTGHATHVRGGQLDELRQPDLGRQLIQDPFLQLSSQIYSSNTAYCLTGRIQRYVLATQGSTALGGIL